MRKLLCLLLTTTLAVSGCATARGNSNRVYTTGGPQQVDTTVMADYLRQLKVGSRVRLSRVGGDDIRGILMKNDGDPVVVQRRSRVPEAPIAVPLRDVLAVELVVPGNGNPARTIAIGAAAAAAGTLGVFLVLAAIFAD